MRLVKARSAWCLRGGGRVRVGRTGREGVHRSARRLGAWQRRSPSQSPRPSLDQPCRPAGRPSWGACRAARPGLGVHGKGSRARRPIRGRARSYWSVGPRTIPAVRFRAPTECPVPASLCSCSPRRGFCIRVVQSDFPFSEKTLVMYVLRI